MKAIVKKYQIFTLIVLGMHIFNLSVLSQVPEKMSYQAVIKNSEGDLVVGQDVDIRLQIMKDPEYNQVIYDEKFQIKTDSNGFVAIEIGTGEIVHGTFNSINWANGIYYLRVEVDPGGHETYTVILDSPYTTVPYTYYAITAGVEDEKDPVFSNSVSGTISTTDITNWNSKQDSFSETDPAFSISVAKNISESDTARWNHKLVSESHNLGNVLLLGNDGSRYRLKQIGEPTDNQDVATKAYVDVLIKQIDTLTKKLNTYIAGGKVTDIDGNEYNTVIIGNQIWMVENLRTTRYSDGKSIPYITDTNSWDSLTLSSKAYCWYNNDTVNKVTYGALYTWRAAMNGSSSSTANPSGVQGVCPAGWHLPSDAEWTELTDYLGGEMSAYYKLKESGTSHWANSIFRATNETGFTALPGGGRNYNGSFYFFHMVGLWWTATQSHSNAALYRGIVYNYNIIERSSLTFDNGYSVRCLKD